MHLLREGQFSVAATFATEAAKDNHRVESQPMMVDGEASLEDDLETESLKSEELRKQFANMYHVLHELRNERNLLPAIQWARENSKALEERGSNLEFESGKLQFVWLFTGGSNSHDPMSLAQSQQQALRYARSEFTGFQTRYLKEIQKLSAAMAFSPNLPQSPYRQIFHNEGAWEDLANSFTREFCSLLCLSADSPLYIAATAGAIALPTMLKLQTIMKVKKTEWTTQDELAVSRYECFWNIEINHAGRNPFTSCIPFSLHFRLPGLQGANNRSKPTNDDAVRARHRTGVYGQAAQRLEVQMPLLSW